MKQLNLILFFLLSFSFSIFCQDTYSIGSTEYYYNKTYSTTGKPMVKRSSKNKTKFLNSKGHSKTPFGYEIDHIIPLSEGGSDDPSNMQLLTIKEHNKKTAQERKANSNSTYTNYSNSYYSNSTNSSDSYEYSNGRKEYIGKNGGRYYINSNGNKTYIKTKKISSPSYGESSYNSTSTFTSACGARNKSGGYCKRKVKGGGRCHSHK